MKICEDCQHFSGWNLCSAPENGLSPVDGKPSLMFAGERRSSGRESLIYPGLVKCGPGGLHFKPKQPKQATKKPWWKFFK